MQALFLSGHGCVQALLVQNHSFQIFYANLEHLCNCGFAQARICAFVQKRFVYLWDCVFVTLRFWAGANELSKNIESGVSIWMT